jgi:hypothetical protein
MTAALKPAPVPQHMHALGQANRVRLARAALKRDIGHGAVSVAEVLRQVPWEAETMTIADLLLSQHRWGTMRMRRFLGCLRDPASGYHLGVGEHKQLGAMTVRQRELIADVLGGEIS